MAEKMPGSSGPEDHIPSALEAGLKRRGIEPLEKKEPEVREETGELKTSLEIASERASKIAAAEETEAEALPAPEREQLEKRLEAARAEFLKAEKEYGDGTRASEELDDRYYDARDAYERARAEYVADDVLKHVHEETEVLKQRVEAGEAKGLFEKLHGAWKWLSEKNVSKAYDPDNKILKVGARMLNLRTAISGALIGAAWMVPGAQVGVLAVRQALAGAGTAFLAYDLQRKYGEVKAADVSGLDEMTPQEVAEKFHALTAFAKLKGSWEGLEGAHAKLRERYERDMAIAVAWGMDLQEYTWGLEEKEQRKESARKWKALGAGVLGGLGLAGLRHLMQSGEIANAFSRMKELIPGGKPTLEELASQGTPRLPLSGADVLAPGVKSEKIIEAISAGEAAKNAAELSVSFQPGESPLHEARKALALYLSEDESQAFRALTPAEKLWAEERLWKITQEQLKSTGALKEVWQPGDKLVFKKEAVEQALSELQQKFGSPEKLKALTENLKDHVGKVDWKRYAVAAGHGAWEGDLGVRLRLPAEALADPRVNEKMLDALLEEARRYPGITVPGEEAGTLLAASEDGGAVVIELDDPRHGEVFFSAEEAARLELVKDKLAEAISGLDAEEYNAIRTMRASDLLKKSFWQLTDETRWPEGTRQTHVDIMKRLNLKDRIKEAFEALPEGERTDVGGLDVHDFIRTYLLKGGAKV